MFTFAQVISAQTGTEKSQGMGNSLGFVDAFNPIIGNNSGTWIKTLVLPDGKILAAGEVKVVNGTNRNSLARFNADGSLDTTFNTGAGANSTIFTIDRQADGKILVGGDFTTYNGVTVGRLVRLNEDGTLDMTFNTTGGVSGTGADYFIAKVKALPDGKILVAGDFSKWNGTARNRLTRLNADGTLDPTFNLIGSGPLKTVLTFDVFPDGKAVVGGDFTGWNGIPIGHLAKINADGSLDTTFSIGTGANEVVRGIVIQPDGKIIVSGFFNGFAGVTKNGITRLKKDGTNDDTFNVAGLDAVVLTVALQPDGKMIVGGSFSRIANADRKSMARLNADGTLDESFDPGTGTGAEVINDIVLQPDGKASVVGSFKVYKGTPNGGAIRINSDGSLDTNLASTSSLSGIVQSMAVQPDGKIIIGGNKFTSVNGTPRNSIARLNADSSLDTSFDPGTGVNVAVYAIDMQKDGKIIIGGNFSTYNGTTINGIARLNADGSLDSSFAVGTGFLGDVLATKVQPDGKILVGGKFTKFNGVTVSRFVRLNTDGTLDSSFTTGTSTIFDIRSIVLLADNKILIGGSFNSYNGATRKNIARVNTDGTVDTTFDPGVSTNGPISSIGLQADGKIVVGGNFTTVLGAGRNRIARFNANGSFDTSFNPGIGPGVGTATEVTQVLPLANGKTLIAGTFTMFNNKPLNRVARLNANGSLDSSFLNGIGAITTPGLAVRSLAQQADGKILIGGQFSSFNTEARTGIARFSNANKTFADFDADGKADISIFRPSDGSWWNLRSAGSDFSVFRFGTATDKIVPGDYTGDGKTDPAVFREGTWYIQRSEDNSYYSFPFGSAEDIPAPADYDADGKTDAAVFRPSTGTWYIQNSGGSAASIVPFGTSEDKPVAADFDGDGKADIAVFRPSDGSWWYLQSSDNQFKVFRFGVGTDKPVQGDYTGDGKADIAVFRPSTSEWFVQRSEDNSYYSIPFGQAGDVPAPGDYDGDGKFDASVFRPSNGTWYMNQTTAGAGSVVFGNAEDRPVPNAYVP